MRFGNSENDVRGMSTYEMKSATKLIWSNRVVGNDYVNNIFLSKCGSPPMVQIFRNAA